MNELDKEKHCCVSNNQQKTAQTLSCSVANCRINHPTSFRASPHLSCQNVDVPELPEYFIDKPAAVTNHGRGCRICGTMA